MRFANGLFFAFNMRYVGFNLLLLFGYNEEKLFL